MIDITVICGPTASGKSALAVDLARQQHGIIINADSMQVYDALPVLTAQPGAEDREAAPHVLYGALPPRERCSAQSWRALAVAEIEKAAAQGRHPVIVGGTGLYLKALTHGLSAMPDVPPEIRAASIALQESLGNPGFHAALAKRDPVMAARLNPNDRQRLIRAYEVIEATGRSLAEWQDSPLQPPPEDWRFRIVIKSPERAELHARCDRRFSMMLEQGALEEISALHQAIAAGIVPEDAPITHALGFHPLCDFLEGRIDRAEAVARAQAETRQYAKRQDTWFRHQIAPSEHIEEIVRVP
ncbi:MAG: tRNA (adenosine(37)-N6)-dimethylallyltransferase MiaA [Micavibrio aeruginosavorus]|nr:tRNA (adenosine(37)-N6)-dimethylallyltransferase MiaA [Micavibrio aeruginosavorus]